MCSFKDYTSIALVIKKIFKYFTESYFDKYVVLNLSTYIAATYLDVRTKLFGRVDGSRKKNYIKLAQKTIKSICPTGQQEISQFVKISNDTMSTQSVNR